MEREEFLMQEATERQQQRADARPLMTIPEVARVLGCDRSTAWRRAVRGEFPHVRAGNRLLVPRAKLAAMLGVKVEEL